MAQCCICKKKIGFLTGTSIDDALGNEYQTCNTCTYKITRLRWSDNDTVQEFKNIIPSLDDSKLQSYLRTELDKAITTLNKKEQKEELQKRQNEELQKQIKHSFSTSLTIIGAHYESNVSVFSDKVLILRKGYTGKLPLESTIYFENTTAITFGHSFRSWISFSVPGAYQAQSNVVTAIKPGQVVIGGNNPIPYNDPFSVVFGSSNSDYAETHYQKIQKIYDEYKKAHHSSTSSVTNVVQQDGALDKIKKLRELYDLGILSTEEYEEKRLKLLNEI